MCEKKGLTELSIEELKTKILPKPHKPYEIDGIPVFMNTEKIMSSEEIFKKHPELPIEVSNLGRVRFESNILIQFPDTSKSSPYGYLLVRIQNKDYLVYKLVAETWCERPDPNNYNTVHHISNNGMDNRESNLLWVTTEQHEKIHPFLKNMKKGNMQ